MIEDGATTTASRRRFEPLAALDTAEALASLRRHAPLIGALALLGGAACYGGSLLLPQSFVADAQIFVDPRSIQALDTQAKSSDANAEVLFVESQAQIITSQSVLSRVVASQKLGSDPEFNAAGASEPPLRPSLDGEPATTSGADRAALATLADRVTVRRPERTSVLDVAVRARTADKAARLANAVAQAYFDEQADAHAGMARRANRALSDRLDELRDRVRSAEARADTFRREHNLVGTRTQLVSEQQLTDANTQLALARTRVIQAQSRLDEIRKLGTPGGIPGTSAEALGSPTITLLRGQQAEAHRRLDKATAQLGPRHPDVLAARSEVDGLDHAVAAELARIAAAARSDLARASGAEDAQRQVVDNLSGQASSNNAALAQLGEIEREIDVNKNLLNTFLSRARETSELEQVNTAAARLISTALPPRNRTFPPRGSLFALLGVLLGGGCGVALALMRAARRAGARFGRDFDFVAPRPPARPAAPDPVPQPRRA